MSLTFIHSYHQPRGNESFYLIDEVGKEQLKNDKKCDIIYDKIQQMFLS